MRLTKRRRSTMADMNMTPMIDIVFLLIIFFMTVSQISKVNHERLQLPQQEGSEDQADGRVTVNVRQNGEIVVGGKVLSIDRLIGVFSNNLAAVGDDPTQMTLILRGDRGARSETANEIVDAARQLGISKIYVTVQVPR
ncbi:MAG: biopolymer transporter ExbD [Pirellulaceae bacterium]|nr:biopolymer transporter ExbD [Pirellulaceae bacterium]MDP7020034.1 biopolymer transporter ExbD [Pirellulaceae bacterium]